MRSVTNKRALVNGTVNTGRVVQAAKKGEEERYAHQCIDSTRNRSSDFVC